MLQRLLDLDNTWRAWVVTHRVQMFDQPMSALSWASYLGILWLVIAAGFAIARRLSWRDVGRLALALATTALLTDYALKPVIDRARPYFMTPEIHVMVERPSNSSFPSGHAATAAAGAVVLTAVLPPGLVVWWLLAIGIGYSRVYLGVHFPFDVIAGAFTGAATAVLALWLTRTANATDRASAASPKTPRDQTQGRT